ncbi:hypothetical protein KKD80_03300 [Patescibacteria group bacterium]|nr:hypothetical protein [Patescibacteria group bacterium]
MRKIILIIFFLILFLPGLARAAANPVELYFFEGQGCPHCARMKSYLEGLKVDYPNLTVKDFEVYFDKENQDLFQKMTAAYNSNSNGVPMIFIGNEVIVGESYEKLKNAVEKCSTEEVCESPGSKVQGMGDIDVNAPAPGGNEAAGWITIGVIAVFGVMFIYFIIKKKK